MHTNTAFVLVGGLGTRLKSLFPETAKPLVPLGGVPFLELQLQFLKREGIREIFLLAGHKSEDFKKFVDGFKDSDLKGRLIVEEKPLGSAGAVGLAYSQTKNLQSVLVVNGDTHFEGSLSELLNSKVSADYQVLLSFKENADRYGLVELGADQKIQKFCEKQAGSSGWVHSGFVVLSKKVLDSLPTDQFQSLEKDVFPKFNGVGVQGTGQFFDYGLPQDYLELNRDLWIQKLHREDPVKAKAAVHALEAFLAIPLNDEDCRMDSRSFQMRQKADQEISSAKKLLDGLDPNLSQGIGMALVNPSLILPKVQVESKTPCVFIDRDGTMIEHIHYLKEPEKVSLLPGVVKLLKDFKSRGWKIIVITNQSGVGREYFNWETYEKVHRQMLALLSDAGIELDWTFAAPYYSDSKRWSGRVHELVRKPFPGVAKLSEKLFSVDLSQSIMVGDSHVDAGFAMMSGLKSIYWIDGKMPDLSKNPPPFKINPETEIKIIHSLDEIPRPN